MILLIYQFIIMMLLIGITTGDWNYIFFMSVIACLITGVLWVTREENELEDQKPDPLYLEAMNELNEIDRIYGLIEEQPVEVETKGLPERSLSRNYNFRVGRDQTPTGRYPYGRWEDSSVRCAPRMAQKQLAYARSRSPRGTTGSGPG